MRIKTDELERCPFCGGKAFVMYQKPFSYACCRDCHAHTAMIPDFDKKYDSVKKAVIAWNMRYEPMYFNDMKG